MKVIKSSLKMDLSNTPCTVLGSKSVIIADFQEHTHAFMHAHTPVKTRINYVKLANEEQTVGKWRLHMAVSLA